VKFEAGLTWKKSLIALAFTVLGIDQYVAARNLGSAPQSNVTVQGQTGAQPEVAFLNFINWTANVIALRGAVVGAAISRCPSYAEAGHDRGCDKLSILIGDPSVLSLVGQVAERK